MIGPIAASVVVIGTMSVVCAPYDAIVEELTALGETFDSGGPAIERHASVELWRNHDAQQWHLLKRFPNGVACIIAAGVDWKGGDGI